ncbi:Class II abasic (AP) endonuclease [Boothiomyces sp. JEL0866]|nr:Class II abasic (AP) endonuclease [Boothiomyces sp. JEL0866]
MKILSWNVNGIKTIKEYYPWKQCDFAGIISGLDADIICFQEVKQTLASLPSSYTHVPDYDIFYFLHKDKGYSGVATVVKKSISPEFVEIGMSGLKEPNLGCLEELQKEFTKEELAELDSEARVIITDHKLFVLFNIYFPNDANETRFEYKMKFSKAIEIRAASFMKQGRSVIIAGDVNVSHKEIDHCDPAQSVKDNRLESFDSAIARQWFNSWVYPNGQLVDSFRWFYPDKEKVFTVWNTKINARPANYGTRIDYILVSKELIDDVKDAQVLSDVLGSDHCPVTLEFKDTHHSLKKSIYELLKSDMKKPHPLCTFYWDNYAAKQLKINNFFKKVTKQDLLQKQSDSALRIQKKPSQKSMKSFLIEKQTQNIVDLDHVIALNYLENNMTPPVLGKEHMKSKGWDFMLKKREIPKCNHGDECVEMVVKKAGPNKGKYFYACPRKVGNTADSKCDFFSWK